MSKNQFDEALVGNAEQYERVLDAVLETSSSEIRRQINQVVEAMLRKDGTCERKFKRFLGAMLLEGVGYCFRVDKVESYRRALKIVASNTPEQVQQNIERTAKVSIVLSQACELRQEMLERALSVAFFEGMKHCIELVQRCTANGQFEHLTGKDEEPEGRILALYQAVGLIDE